MGGDFNGQRVARFAVAEVLRGDFEARAEAMSSLVQAGIAKPSEARPFFDFDDAGPVADKLYANSAIQPLGAEKPAPPAPALHNEPSNVVPFPAAKYVRDIGGLIGRGKSIQEAASTLLDKYPADRDAIREACEQIIERQI